MEYFRLNITSNVPDNMKSIKIIQILFIITLVTLSGCVNQTDLSEEKDIEFNLKTVSGEEFRDLIESMNETDTILDLRTPQEYSEGHIKNSQTLDFYSETFSKELDLLDKKSNYYIYCRSGHRSKLTLDSMRELGFENVYNLKGGITEWISSENNIIK